MALRLGETAKEEAFALTFQGYEAACIDIETNNIARLKGCDLIKRQAGAVEDAIQHHVGGGQPVLHLLLPLGVACLGVEGAGALEQLADRIERRLRDDDEHAAAVIQDLEEDLDGDDRDFGLAQDLEVELGLDLFDLEGDGRNCVEKRLELGNDDIEDALCEAGLERCEGAVALEGGHAAVAAESSVGEREDEAAVEADDHLRIPLARVVDAGDAVFVAFEDVPGIAALDLVYEER